MIYLLDTNACVVYLNGRAPRLRQKLDKFQPADIAVCSIVKAELFYGSMKSNNPAGSLKKQQQFLSPYVSLPFDDSATSSYARLRADLEAGGTPIGGNDMMIAAIALSNDLTLVTHNAREFRRIAGLHVEDWETDP